MKKFILSFLFLSALPMIALAAVKEIKVSKVTGLVRIISGGEISAAAVGAVLPPNATLKTYSGAQVVLSIGRNTRVIEENRTISAAALAGGDSGLESAMNLIGKLTSRAYSSGNASQVAGVRGAEQGKKGSFGVQWQGQSQAKPAASAVSASAELDQARALCQSQDFEGAIAKLDGYLASGPDDQAKAKANLLLAQAKLELVLHADALMAAEAGIALEPRDAAVLAQLRFAAVSAIWLSGKADATVAAVDKHFPASGAAGDEHWNAQMIKVLALKAMGNKAAAKKLKAAVSSGCPNDEIVAALAQISL
jgi:hypothetical protein